MNGKLEQIAKAMADAVALNYDNNEVIFKLYARIAVEVMREPNAGMIIDGTQSVPGYKINIDAVERCWHAMIDAALKDD